MQKVPRLQNMNIRHKTISRVRICNFMFPILVLFGNQHTLIIVLIGFCINRDEGEGREPREEA